MSVLPTKTLNHREACDSCHSRKVRCISGNGACTNCKSSSTICIYSPKNPAGRPRTRKKRAPTLIIPSPVSPVEHCSREQEPGAMLQGQRGQNAQTSPTTHSHYSPTFPHHPSSSITLGHKLPSFHAMGMSDTSNLDSAMAGDTIDFNLESLQGDMFAWTGDTLQDGRQAADEVFNQSWTAHPTPAPTPTTQSFPTVDGLDKVATSSPPTDGGTSRNSALTTSAQPPMDALLDLVVELQSLQNRGTGQARCSDNEWLRDDEPVFQSLAVLCGVVEELIKCNSDVSQMQVVLYLTHKASISAVDAMQYVVSQTRARHFQVEDRRTRSGSWPGHSQSTKSIETVLKVAPSVALAEQELSIAAILANRLHNTIQLTSSSFQAARLLLLMERIVKLLGDGTVAMPSNPIEPMKHTCVRLDSIMDELQAMVVALRAPIVSHGF